MLDENTGGKRGKSDRRGPQGNLTGGGQQEARGLLWVLKTPL